ncbi:MAG TPA: type II toxin-antitoxin system VapC family toxin [Gammaproteobacteria bacterium]|nr:type II toxin-antitoxin system VapC family toxin [Gammaproteobacteria bacterium]
MFVLDASVALSWLLPDERNDGTQTLFQRLVREAALVPAIWLFETGNALRSAVRSKRITAEQAWIVADDLLALPVELDQIGREERLKRALNVALQTGVSIYDAAYLELSQRRQLPLATLDRRLREACAELNIPVLPDNV